MSLSKGPLLAAVGIQLAILAAIPLRQAKARALGTEITLETAPVDPYDLLSGYHVTLAYRAEQLAPAVGGDEGGAAWLVVARAAPGWRPVSCSRGAAPVVREDQVAIAAEVVHGRCAITTARRFYVPEDRRQEIDAALRAVRGAALVDLKVDAGGNVALLRLRAGSVVVGSR
jgi:uncharacterized membrane-anchored protein